MKSKDVLWVFGAWFIAGAVLPGPVAGCALPLDADVAIVLNNKSSYDEAGNTFVVDEDAQVRWVAYWDATEAPNTPEVAQALGMGLFHEFEGHKLIDLDTYRIAFGAAHTKVSEIHTRSGVSQYGSNWDKYPDAPIMVDAEIQGANMSARLTKGPSLAFSSGSLASLPRNGRQVGSGGPNSTWPIEVEDAHWTGCGGKWNLIDVKTYWALDEENSGVWRGTQGDTKEGFAFSCVYPTPTGKTTRIRVGCELFTKFRYEPSDAVWQWKETAKGPNGETADSRECEATAAGTIERNSTDANGGFPYGYVRVKDLHGPQHFKVEPTKLEATVGKVPAGGAPITVKVLDNNPFTAEYGTPGPARLWYSAVVHGWEQAPGELNLTSLCQSDPGHHVHPGFCDCQAYHKEKWVWKMALLKYDGVDVVDYQGKKAYAVLKYTLDQPLEPAGWHHALNSTGGQYKNATYEPWAEGRLKYFATAQAVGPGDAWVDGTPCSLTHNQEDASAKEPAPLELVNAGGAGAVTGPESADGSKCPPADFLMGKIGADAGDWGKWGRYGKTEVKDDMPPNVRLYVTDTKYGFTVCYGNEDAIDGSLGQYTTAKGGGAAESLDNGISPYLAADPAPSPWDFNDNGQLDGYALQRTMVEDGEFEPLVHIATDGAKYGFWCDEDTRLVFFTVARDNTNQWLTVLPAPGALSDPGSSDELEDLGGGKYAYVFRDPNKGLDAVDRDCTMTVTASGTGGSTTLVVHFFVASNKLQLQTLEEERKRRNGP